MAVERTTRDIRSLIHSISSGEIMLPEIQRGYVWKAPQVAKLVESLYRGYPAGSLLFWKTEAEAETRTAAVSGGQGRPGVLPLYLLDGQQRLTSLHRVLTDNSAAQIVFNIETEAFQNQSSSTRNNRKWVKVYDVVGPEADTFAVYEQLRSADLAISDSEVRERLKALERIPTRDFHMEVLHGFDYEEIAEIFVRVNSGGRPLKTTDLALAMLSARSPGFLAELERESARWAGVGYSGLDVSFLIKAITLSLSVSGKRSASVSKLTVLSPEAVQEGWQRVRRGLARVVPMLRDRLALPTTALIASFAALHPLIVFYGQSPQALAKDLEVERGLLYWFLAASARNRYGGATDTALTQDIRALDTEHPVQSLLANLGIDREALHVNGRDLANKNIQSPYFMLSFLATVHAGARDWWDGRPLTVVAAESGDKVPYALLHPAASLRSRRYRYTTSEVNELANIVFVSTETAKNMIGSRAPAAYIRDISAPDRGAHGIPADSAALETSGYRDFLIQRREILARRITALFDQFRPDHLGGTPVSSADQVWSASLVLTGYAAGTKGVLLAEAVHGGRRFVGSLARGEMQAALDAAASGLNSDVTLGEEEAALEVDEDGTSIVIGPLRVRGTADQWHEVLKSVFEEPLSLADLPVGGLVGEPCEPVDFLLSDAVLGSR